MADKKFEQDDPLSLNGMVLDLPPEEAKRAEADMAACFIEEYLRIGCSPEKIFSLFKDPFYQGTHAVFKSRGEDYVRGLIREV